MDFPEQLLVVVMGFRKLFFLSGASAGALPLQRPCALSALALLPSALALGSLVPALSSCSPGAL